MSLLNNMTDLEKRVFCFIPLGSERKVKSEEIERVFGITSRQVRDIAYNLTQIGIPVVTSKKKDGGYYIPTNERERYEGLKSYKNQIRTSLKIIDIVESVDLNDFNVFMEDLRYDR